MGAFQDTGDDYTTPDERARMERAVRQVAAVKEVLATLELRAEAYVQQKLDRKCWSGSAEAHRAARVLRRALEVE